MDLKFTDEQRMLRETTRDLCVSHCGVDVVRKMENDPLGVPQALWQNMQEMGLLGILLPQDLGGMGLNMLDCAVIYEEFGRALAEHFVRSVETVQWARVSIEEYGWERILTEDGPHDHSFVRQGQEVRTTSVTAELRDRELAVSVVSGLKDLTILKSTGSEFRGFHVDKYTTLAETDDRILATSLVARWRYADLDVDFDDCYARARRVMLSRFATVHSRALQESLYQMGIAALDEVPQLAEVRFSAPNKHHFLVDLDRFGVANDGEVFFAADRPYGLIEAAVVREGSTGQWPVESFC